MLARIALAAALAIAGGALAQPPRADNGAGQTRVPGVLTPQERFKAADANGDGKVDRAEFAATLNPDARPYIEAIWANRDTNKDGWLTQEEMTSNGAAPALGRAGARPPAP